MILSVRQDPIDPNVALITDYLARELTAEQSAAVEERLATDHDFYMDVAPIIKAWQVSAHDRLDYHTGFADAPPSPSRARRYVARIAFAAVAAFMVFGSAMFLYVSASGMVQNKRDELTGRAKSGDVQLGATTTSQAGGSATVTLRHGSVVTLRGEALFKFTATPPILPAAVFATLDGEAAFEITPKEGTVQVTTSAGAVYFGAGSYAVRCAPGCTAMLITVAAGAARVKSDSSDQTLVLSGGEKGYVPRVGRPRKEAVGDDWPLAPARTETAGTTGRAS
jgi:ferric-dicitrate binding protein FerR (iron transport regulator)